MKRHKPRKYVASFRYNVDERRLFDGLRVGKGKHRESLNECIRRLAITEARERNQNLPK